jgi:hypothetical protein
MRSDDWAVNATLFNTLCAWPFNSSEQRAASPLPLGSRRRDGLYSDWTVVSADKVGPNLARRDANTIVSRSSQRAYRHLQLICKTFIQRFESARRLHQNQYFAKQNQQVSQARAVFANPAPNGRLPPAQNWPGSRGCRYERFASLIGRGIIPTVRGPNDCLHPDTPCRPVIQVIRFPLRSRLSKVALDAL